MSFYSFGRRICLFFLRFYFKIEVKGVEHLEKNSGGMILIANHKSFLDPVLMGLFVKRRLFFMAKKELFCIPIFGSIIRKLGAFPVDREKRGFEALKVACNTVEKGEIVAIFPQGHRSKDIEGCIPKTGFFRVALISSCAVVPCSLYYKSYLPRSRVYVHYQKPLDVFKFIEKEGFKLEDLNYKDIKFLTLKFWENVKKLYKEQDMLYKNRLK